MSRTCGVMYFDDTTESWQPTRRSPERYRAWGSSMGSRFKRGTTSMSSWNNKDAIDRPDYDQDKADKGEYNSKDLEYYADQILRKESASVDPETGKRRGIGGENPILFEEHIYARKRREIFCEQGVPDPSIVAGIYNRYHPKGRKINSSSQRKSNGASYYRAITLGPVSCDYSHIGLVAMMVLFVTIIAFGIYERFSEDGTIPRG